MHLKLLGTGAADYDWACFGEPGVRGSTSSLLNGHVLIDCGTTGTGNLKRFGIPCSAVDALLVTHSHSDHFAPERIPRVTSARSGCRRPGGAANLLGETCQCSGFPDPRSGGPFFIL